MHASRVIRPIHRWISLAFILGIIADSTIIATVGDQLPAPSAYLLALVPLVLSLLTGLSLFALPALGRRG